MPCFVGCLALVFPRLALFFVWILGGDYLARVYEHWIIPVFGWIFLPLTTLAVAFGMNTLGAPGRMEPMGWLLVAIALAADLGLIRGSHRATFEFRVRRKDGTSRRILRFGGRRSGGGNKD
jgi:hypothetical protein